MGWLRVVMAAGLIALAACGGNSPVDADFGGWEPVGPPAAGARVLAVTAAGDELLALGSVPGPEGRSPAAWTTGDGRRWEAVTVTPRSGYGVVAELISGGVGERVVVLGQAFGGAHFNPRMTVWAGDRSALEEFPQSFEQFGGPRAIGVGGAAAFGGTGLLVGAWDGSGGRYGVAVWTSKDGANWVRQADDPALSAGPGEVTGAGGVAAGPGGFVVAGNSIRGVDYQPLEWVSSDGYSWQRIPLSGSGVADRVACAATEQADPCVVVGRTVGVRPQLLCWPTASVYRTGPGGGTLDVDQALLRADELLMSIRVDGAARLLTAGRDCTGMREVPLPVRAPRAFVGNLPGGLLLATTDPDGDSRIWLRAMAG
ncbi:hypothetical protein H0264_29005 [Nocardia huaxiensis]|uniref:Galactose oxidase n=1 Tax=Nocardia huaxiensis TaxID=2755382 RepID=A0A7D6ZUV2_9NOCA|nr:hypothetical protein [Nocardia huaxiensis]QLY29289.1 hypothetical protein H0264_29005 [Nocardia huaxiensis]